MLRQQHSVTSLRRLAANALHVLELSAAGRCRPQDSVHRVIRACSATWTMCAARTLPACMSRLKQVKSRPCAPLTVVEHGERRFTAAQDRPTHASAEAAREVYSRRPLSEKPACTAAIKASWIVRGHTLRSPALPYAQHGGASLSSTCRQAWALQSNKFILPPSGKRLTKSSRIASTSASSSSALTGRR